jgi:hypothetical protein
MIVKDLSPWQISVPFMGVPVSHIGILVLASNFNPFWQSKFEISLRSEKSIQVRGPVQNFVTWWLLYGEVLLVQLIPQDKGPP